MPDHGRLKMDPGGGQTAKKSACHAWLSSKSARIWAAIGKSLLMAGAAKLWPICQALHQPSDYLQPAKPVKGNSPTVAASGAAWGDTA